MLGPARRPLGHTPDEEMTSQCACAPSLPCQLSQGCSKPTWQRKHWPEAVGLLAPHESSMPAPHAQPSLPWRPGLPVQKQTHRGVAFAPEPPRKWHQMVLSADHLQVLHLISQQTSQLPRIARAAYRLVGRGQGESARCTSVPSPRRRECAVSCRLIPPGTSQPPRGAYGTPVCAMPQWSLLPQGFLPKPPWMPQCFPFSQTV